MRRGNVERGTHDYNPWHDSLFAALELNDQPRVIGQRHPAATAAGIRPVPRCDRGGKCQPAESIYVDNYGTHKNCHHPEMVRGPKRPRLYVPSRQIGSWIKPGERWFAELPTSELSTGTFTQRKAWKRHPRIHRLPNEIPSPSFDQKPRTKILAASARYRSERPPLT